MVGQVLENREAGISLSAAAVLFRASHHSGPLEVELTRRNIPFVKYGGLKFLEAAHVKDLIAVLRWAENPRDRVAGFRVLQLLPGIGPRARLGFSTNLVVTKMSRRARLFTPPLAADKDWRLPSELVRRIKAARMGWPERSTGARLWYEPQLERIYDDALQPQRRSDSARADRAGYASASAF